MQCIMYTIMHKQLAWAVTGARHTRDWVPNRTGYFGSGFLANMLWD